MKVTVTAPPPPVATVSISDLTIKEVNAILMSLKHCSGGHIDCFDREDKASIPGRLYNELCGKLCGVLPT